MYMVESIMEPCSTYCSYRLDGSNEVRVKRAAPGRNWDFTLPWAEAHLTKMLQAWEDMLLLIQIVDDQRGKNDPAISRIFSHYFKDGDRTKVEAIFKELWSAGANRGSPLFPNIVISNIPAKEDLCDEGNVAAWLDWKDEDLRLDKPYTLRLCNVAYQYPLWTETRCEDLKAGLVTSGKMSILGGIILHELM